MDRVVRMPTPHRACHGLDQSKLNESKEFTASRASFEPSVSGRAHERHPVSLDGHLGAIRPKADQLSLIAKPPLWRQAGRKPRKAQKRHGRYLNTHWASSAITQMHLFVQSSDRFFS
jgi:hypothetical protein